LFCWFRFIAADYPPYVEGFIDASAGTVECRKVNFVSISKTGSELAKPLPIARIYLSAQHQVKRIRPLAGQWHASELHCRDRGDGSGCGKCSS
jgi:hypothetical protein